MNYWQREIISGSAAGMANQIVCQPFDMLRTRLQMEHGQARPSSAVATLRKVVGHEGVLALYKGFTPPFFAQAVYKSVLFSSNAAFKHGIRVWTNRDQLLVPHIVFCGMLSGMVNSLVVTPVELCRNQLMMQVSNSDKRYKGPRAIIGHVRGLSNGNVISFVRYMYRGWTATVIRDGLGVSMWFTSYHLTTTNLKAKLGRDLYILELMLCGCMSGIMFWLVALPFDGMKSQMQCNSLDAPRITLTDAFQRCRHRLYRGYQVAFGRGIPGAAVTLTVHRVVFDQLSK